MDIIGFNEQIGAGFKKGITAMTKKMTRNMPKAVMPKRILQKIKLPIKGLMPKMVMPKVLKPKNIFQKAKVVVANPIFKKAGVPMRRNSPPTSTNMNTQTIMPSIQNLSPQNQITTIREVAITPQNMAQLNPIQQSFSKADLPYQPIIKKRPRIKLKNSPLTYSTSINMIEPSVDGGMSNYYGK